MKFETGDRVEVFTSPGVWLPAEVYAVGGDYYVVGNGDPVYGPNGEIRDSFRVHKSDARRRPSKFETGMVVAVLTHNGEVGYFGDVASLPVPGSDASLFDRGKIGVYNPETDEVHFVAAADGEGLREATDAETDVYWEKYGEPGTPVGPEA